MTDTYPPQPWHLFGQMYLSVWVVPARRLDGGIPPGAKPVGFGRFALLGAAWVRYQAGSVLEYDELLAAVLVRRGWRLRVTVTDIWVDSVPSRNGGRALWAIPKDLAEFEFTGPDELAGRPDELAGRPDELGASATVDGQPTARATFRRRRRLPGTLATRYTLSQPCGPKPLDSPVRSRSGLDLASATWDFDASGRLGRLHGIGRPLLSLHLRDFRIRFGSRTS